jgi:hypothetical protein
MKNIKFKSPEKKIIGMVHVAALPGTPAHSLPVEQIIKQALAEAQTLREAGVDAILIENMHDVPYLKRNVGPEIVSSMTAICSEIRHQIDLPMGVQILAGANREALAVALAADLDFIRAEGFVFGHLADEGYMDSCAGELLRYRKQIGAEHILIFTDILKKHSSHAITSDLSLREHVETAEYFRSDGIIITGSSTGKEPQPEDVAVAKKSTSLPVMIGSGITTDNLSKYWHLADAFIVGSWLKEEGNWGNPVSPERARLFMQQVAKLRNNLKAV